MCLIAKKVTAPQKVEAISTQPNSQVSPSPVSTLEKHQRELSKNEIEELLKSEFKDAPIMVRIASCESQFRQFDVDGTVLRGKQNPLDRGLFQINEYYHLEASKRLNMDIYTLKGNMAYARHLYEQSGTTPWNWSKECWSSKSL